MAQFIVGFMAGIYVGTNYNCKPALSMATNAFDLYCPKRDEEATIQAEKAKQAAKAIILLQKTKAAEAAEAAEAAKKWF
jgi:hypothetical protein